MIDESPGRRPVELYTLQGVLCGSLPTAPSRRTLDDLNLASRTFLTLYEEGGTEPGPLAVNKHSVLFVRERAAPSVEPGTQYQRFTRAAVVLQVGPCTVEGFVHVPPGGHPLKRLDQDAHLFLALTSVLATGSGLELTAPFLAVNRHHIARARQVGHLEPAGEELPVDASAIALTGD